MGLSSIIGKDITIRDVYSTLTSPYASSILMGPMLQNVGIKLGVPLQMIDGIRRGVLVDTLTWEMGLLKILENWVAMEGDKATLGKLVETFAEMHLNNSADALLKKFVVESPQVPTKIVDSEEAPIGGSSCLKETLPGRPSYYIKRFLRSRRVLSDGIFQKNATDLFLFPGVTLAHLSAVVKNVSATNSTDQLLQNKITGRFIVLNHPSHFKRICKKTVSTVHCISLLHEKLRWVKSKNGDMKFIQQHIEPDYLQDVFGEDELFKQFDPHSNEPICIVDSPGMGKSVFLCEIGRRIKEFYPAREVIFLPLPEFIKNIQYLQPKFNFKKLAMLIEVALRNMICDGKPSANFLEYLLHNSEENVNIELLLDGFDEVQSTLRLLAYETIKTIAASFTTVRLWVTSRPHLLHELESTLNVLGYHITPFSDEDQLLSITSYWTRSTDSKTNTFRLREFATSCLQDLHSRINARDAGITGIPLQCMMVAEVFEEPASVFADSKGTFFFPVELQYNSIADLYRLLFERKIKKYRNVAGPAAIDDEEIMRMHFKLAFNLLFQEDNPIVTGDFIIEELLKVGIVESSSFDETPRFLHRTFAEHLASKCVSDRLKKEGEWTTTLTKILVDDFLHVNEFEYGDYSLDLTDNLSSLSYEFTTPIPCFLNCMIDDLGVIPKHVLQMCYEKILPVFEKLLHACAHADCLNLCKFLFLITSKDKEHQAKFDIHVVFISAVLASTPFFQFVLAQYETSYDLDLDSQLVILDLALRRGSFYNGQFLLNEKGLRKTFANFESLQEHTKRLLHVCVKKSIRESDILVKQTVEIVRLLVGANSAYLEHTNKYHQTPLLCQEANIRVRLELIKLGANVLAQDKLKRTVLHIKLSPSRSKIPMKDVDYHALITTIPITDVKKLVHIESDEDDWDISRGSTPLESVIRYFDPLPETLNVFKSAGANFNFCNQRGHSILANAIMEGRTASTLRQLIECGSDVRWRKGSKRKNLLHYAADYGNSDAVKLLVEELHFNVNCRDLAWSTPLHYAKAPKRTDTQTMEILKVLSDKWRSCTPSENKKEIDLDEIYYSKSQDKKTIAIKATSSDIRKQYHSETGKQFSSETFLQSDELESSHERAKTLQTVKDNESLGQFQSPLVEKKLEAVRKMYDKKNKMNFNTEAPAIGIDLGTTYCCVGVYYKGKLHIVPNEEEYLTTPSYVTIFPDGSKIVGWPAQNHAYKNLENTIYEVKRMIGRKTGDETLNSDMKLWPFSIESHEGFPKIVIESYEGPKYFHPEQISAMLLVSLREMTERFLKLPAGSITKAVITVPAYFNDGQRQATVDAGELAGLEVLTILNEPTAGAIAYTLEELHSAPRNVLIYDWGGGTFDVALLRTKLEEIDVLGVNGDTHLGGKDFDNKMMEYCADSFKSSTGIDLFKGHDSTIKQIRDDVVRALRRLQAQCEKAKVELSFARITTIVVYAIKNGIDLSVKLTREIFEKLNMPYFKRSIDLIAKTLNDVGIKKDEVDDIVLVGGSSRIPKVQEMLINFFDGKQPSKSIHPDHAVAYGAAVHAAIINGESSFKINIAKDITPLPVGVEVATGELSVIIEKNSKIPLKAREEFYTSFDFQTEVKFSIYQGENLSRAKKNHLLGNFILKGIPAKKAGKEKIYVCMEFNKMGIFRVTAVIQSTLGTTSIVVDEDKMRMPRELIAKYKKS